MSGGPPLNAGEGFFFNMLQNEDFTKVTDVASITVGSAFNASASNANVCSSTTIREFDPAQGGLCDTRSLYTAPTAPFVPWTDTQSPAITPGKGLVSLPRMHLTAEVWVKFPGLKGTRHFSSPFFSCKQGFAHEHRNDYSISTKHFGFSLGKNYRSY